MLCHLLYMGVVCWYVSQKVEVGFGNLAYGGRDTKEISVND